MSGLLVIIPTFNEAENLPMIVGRLRTSQPDADILIVDDDSPDGTGAIAAELSAHSSAAVAPIHVLHRPAKEGLGAAYLAGFEWGTERGYEVFVEMDADGSHSPEELATLLAAIEGGADLVIGSRWISGGAVVNWPAHRQWLSRGGNFYARTMLGIPVHDATGGFRAFRRSTLEGLNLREVASQGYCFQVDMTMRTHQAGFGIVEVPITFVERVRGTSKMSNAIVFEALWRVTFWGLARLFRQLRPVRRRRTP